MAVLSAIRKVEVAPALRHLYLHRLDFRSKTSLEEQVFFSSLLTDLNDCSQDSSEHGTKLKSYYLKVKISRLQLYNSDSLCFDLIAPCKANCLFFFKNRSGRWNKLLLERRDFKNRWAVASVWSTATEIMNQLANGWLSFQNIQTEYS